MQSHKSVSIMQHLHNAHAPVCSMLWTELHKTAHRRHCTGTHYMDGMMLLVKSAELAGVIARAILGLKIKLVLEMFSKSRES